MEDTNVGPGFVYASAEEKEIERLINKIRQLQADKAKLIQALVTIRDFGDNGIYPYNKTIEIARTALAEVPIQKNDCWRVK